MASVGSRTAAGRLLHALRTCGSMSRALATSTADLSRSAAGGAVEELQRLGLIAVGDPDDVKSGRGRPSATLSIRPQSRSVLAIDVQPDRVVSALVDLGRSISHYTRTDLPVAELAPEATISVIVDQLHDAAAHAQGAAPIAVGLSLPGIVDDAAGLARAVLPLHWQRVPVVELLDRTLKDDMSVTLAHDASCAALSEFRLGAGRGAERMLYLTSRHIGVGGALVSRDSGHEPTVHAFQAGHLIVDPTGASCSCGSQGCLELYLDGRAITHAVGLGATADPASIERALGAALRAHRTSPVIRQLFDRLAVGLISMVNTLRPNRVVLGGELAVFATAGKHQLQEMLHRSVIAQLDNVDTVAGAVGYPVLLGAAERAFDDVLRDPAAAVERTNRAALHRRGGFRPDAAASLNGH